jgi:methionyl-tRNA formyltransferase
MGTLRVVVAAQEAAGVQVLRGLVALPRPPQIVAVLTTSGRTRGRRPLVQEAASALGLQIWPGESVRDPDLANRLEGFDVDLLVNVHSLFVVHEAVLTAPRIGSFNLHPGPLPDYAGLNAPSWAVYNGEQSYGVTLHWMDAGIDTGPIAYERSFELTADDTGLAVAGKCVRHGVPLVLNLVEQAQTEPAAIPRRAQDLARRRWHAKGPPNEGRLDWQRPAAEIERFVRAADYAPFPSPWGHPEIELGGRRVGIAKVSLTGVARTDPPGTMQESTDDGLIVATSDELIRVEKLYVDGRYVKPSTSYLAQQGG